MKATPSHGFAEGRFNRASSASSHIFADRQEFWISSSQVIPIIRKISQRKKKVFCNYALFACGHPLQKQEPT
jgi:hypothetical protein